ncbi:MAG: flavodoxin family protein [Candidatus Bathyarchaeia archaeon]
MMRMKALIIYSSVHHKNTEKIAQAMAEVLNADLVETQNAKAEDILKYDLIGFGSGIYMFKHHKLLFKFVKSLKYVEGKRAFIFSTSGSLNGKKFHKKLREELIKKGFNIIGEFNCLGWDTFGFLKLIGGVNKGKPDESDIKNAKNFAKELIKNF